MHTTNEFVTAAVNANHKAGIATWCYFDEFHILLRDELTASYFVAVWKMLRKKGCVPSALTQNVKDLLASPSISNILDNTDFLILLSQAQSDRAILAKQLGISEHQLSYITHSNSGEGLLFYGNVTIPFVDRFPKGEIYNLLTTGRGHFGTKCPEVPQVQVPPQEPAGADRRQQAPHGKAGRKAGEGQGKAGETETAQAARPGSPGGRDGGRRRSRVCAWQAV